MNRKHTLLSTVVLAAALAACAPSPETSFATGQEAFAANDFRGARVALLSGLEKKPEAHDMRVLLARAQLALGDGEGAAASLAKLPDAMEAEPRIKVLRGEAEVLRSQFDTALALVEGIDNGAADRVRGLAFVGLGQLEKAAEAFAAGAARKQPGAPVLAAYARFELARGATAHALELVAQALKADPASVEGYIVRGMVQQRENELPAALASFEQALKRNPSNIDARLGKADVLARMGKLDEAEAIAAELRGETLDDKKVAFLDARIAQGRGKFSDVRKILQKHEAELRGDPDMAMVYGEALIEARQPAVALGILEPEMSRNPNSRPLRRLVASAQMAGGDADAALATIRPLASRPDASPAELKLAAEAAKASGSEAAASFTERLDKPSPQWVGGELAKADQALRNRQWQKAATHYETILSRTGGSNAMVLNNLAFAKQQLGQNEAALAHALKAAQLEPDNASVLDTAGWLLVQTGSKARGIEMLQKAAKLDPKDAVVARHLAEAQ